MTADRLDEIANRHYKPRDPTRKPTWYLDLYDNLLAPFRSRPISLLELGVHDGGSARVWREYFPHALIVGMDIQAHPSGYPEGAHFVQGSQDDPAALARACEVGAAPFDIIIDDAAHVGRLAKASFEYLYDDHLKPGGLYILEDCTTALTRSNWPDSHPYEDPVDDGDRLPSFEYGMPGLVKQLIDRMMLTGNPRRIELQRSVAILHKPR